MCIMAMFLYVIVALLVPHCCGAIIGDVGDALKTIFDIRTAENNTDVKVPSYMYDIYKDAGNRQYNVIRSISPRTESLGARTQLVYDLNALDPTEIVQKAILRFEARPKSHYIDATNVSIYSLAEQTASKTYLGSASIKSSLDLSNTLGSRLLVGLKQLIVQVEGPAKPSIGLVLYSTTVYGKLEKGHELSKYLYETTSNRRKRSVIDNEIDVNRNSFTDELKRKKKKKKKNGSRVSKLQATDAGDTIVFANADQCRMERLSLNFADIGWEDWVIYPKGFETNYCAGGCLFPLGKGSKPTNHATVQSLARSFGRLWDVPEPSCVPDTLAPLTLLYMDRSNHVLLKSYPDMRVITCSCK